MIVAMCNRDVICWGNEFRTDFSKLNAFRYHTPGVLVPQLQNCRRSCVSSRTCYSGKHLSGGMGKASVERCLDLRTG